MSEEALKNNPGEIMGWPFLKIDYETDAAKLAELLPPGIEPGDKPMVHLTVYNVPVPDVPEHGILITVDAKFNGEDGQYAIGYGIDQESAIFISRDQNGQPKYPCEVEYFRLKDKIHARCIHQGYTFMEYSGKSGGDLDAPDSWQENEWWVKVSRAVGEAPGEYDLPPQVVKVASSYQHVSRVKVEGELILRDSPWDPLAERLPVTGEVSAYLSVAQPTGREITKHGTLDPVAFWPFSDTIGGSRWPGVQGGPVRELDYSAYML